MVVYTPTGVAALACVMSVCGVAWSKSWAFTLACKAGVPLIINRHRSIAVLCARQKSKDKREHVPATQFSGEHIRGGTLRRAHSKRQCVWSMLLFHSIFNRLTWSTHGFLRYSSWLSAWCLASSGQQRCQPQGPGYIPEGRRGENRRLGPGFHQDLGKWAEMLKSGLLLSQFTQCAWMWLAMHCTLWWPEAVCMTCAIILMFKTDNK